MSADEVITEVREILKNIAKIDNIKNCVIEFDETVVRGYGFLGDFFFGIITNKDTSEKINVAIKKAFKMKTMREILNIRNAFVVEDHFYSRVFPALDKFQKEKGVPKPVSSIPRHFLSVMEPYKEAIVMENITTLGYEMHDKFQLLEQHKLTAIFREYGKFHALSFAYKANNIEEFRKLTEIHDYFAYLGANEGFRKAINGVCKDIYEYIDQNESNELRAAFKPYAEDAGAIFREYCEYRGEYCGFLHGDCWSNNVMFKYDDSGSVDKICMLDFQLSRSGTPVNDLSYFFYAGAAKEDFDRLDEYLDIYHKSFSDFARQLGSDPEILYPIKSLKEDWKIYAKFGIIMALMMVKVKLIDKEKIADFTGSNGAKDPFSKNNFDKELFIQRGVDIIVHAYEKKFL